jgi:hypothetical protein
MRCDFVREFWDLVSKTSDDADAITTPPEALEIADSVRKVMSDPWG